MASAQLYKRKAGSSNQVPTYLFALSYSNFTFQMYLPGCTLDSHLKGIAQLNVPIIPTIADGYFPFKTEKINLSSNQKIVKEPVPLSLTFEEFDSKWLVPWWKRMGYYAEQLWYWMKRNVSKL